MSERIPNVIHLCYFGAGAFPLVHYLAVASVHELNRPEAIYFYGDKEPTGPWWEKAKPYLKFVETKAPSEIYGVELKHLAHKADVVRLEKLIENGGIYMDMDVICARSFAPLLKCPLVLGEENYRGSTVGLCNAVIMAEPGAHFAKRWLEGFDPERSLWRGFRSQGYDQYYSELSVKYPKFLSTIYAEEIHVEPYTSFFNPSYAPEALQQFFTSMDGNYSGAYAHHLWNNAQGDYLIDLTVEAIKTTDSTFNMLARNYL